LIRHVVIFEWAETASNDQVAAVAAGLDTMPDKVPGILAYRHGDDLGLSAVTADYALVADFATVEDFGAYAGHPDHLAFIEERIQPIAAAVHRVQYHVSE
jgi:hypothetical protein